MNKVLPLFVFALLLWGCSTISDKAAQSKAEEALNLLDQENSQLLTQWSNRPFLFEGEILLSEGLISELWSGLAGKGLSTAEISRIAVVDEQSYKAFADTWEVNTWFQNYTGPQTLMVFFNWEDRELVLLVDKQRGEDQPIQGFGEVRQ